MYVRSCNSATKLRDDFLLNGLLLLLLLLLLHCKVNDTYLPR